MSDDSYRDDLEATLRRADELEQANAALAARNAALEQGLVPAAPKAVAKRERSAPAVLFATGLIAVMVLTAVTGSPMVFGVGFILLIAVPFAFLMLRAIKWFDESD